MMKKTQYGATLTTTLLMVGLIAFILITAVKLVPSYTEFYSVRSLMEEVAQDADVRSGNTQVLRRKLDDYLNINGLYNIQREHFAIVPKPENKSIKMLQVKYETKKHWMANIDFLLSFEHAVELNKP
ncbi:MAG: hypothetical protein CR991_01295 [Proteobacteria bacterium]|nr:MAG: hypothetical protein CR991_01295 [Pseudomonadota bacterium]